MKMKNIIMSVIILLVAACKPASDRMVPEDRPIQVKVQAVESREYKLPVRAVGLLSTTTEVKLGFKTGGIVRKQYFKEGSSVKRGELLAVLDLSEIDAQVRQASIGLEKAGRDLTRAENLYHDSVVTLEQFQNARSAYELARSQKRIADFNRQHSRITAPANGKIQKILVEEDEMIAPGYPAILFASTENDWVVRTALTDKDIVKFTIGDSAHVVMDAFPDTRFSAEITELGAIADPVTGTYEAELRILHSDPQFRTGFIARADLYPTQTIESAVIPLESLLGASDKIASVYIYRDGEVSKRRIRMGMIMGDMVAVTEGVEPGELVVTEGAKYIMKDSPVEVVDLHEIKEK